LTVRAQAHRDTFVVDSEAIAIVDGKRYLNYSGDVQKR
jgi:hypothetical protein